MMRSLYSGVAGLRTHQTKMDVLGNNIANVNTTSFKSQSITFSDLMYQTTQTASGATATKGGVNARQIGLGAKSGAIATAIESQGATQTTNNPFDIMITGKSFFVVNNGKENLYTRDGSFYVDGAGNLAMQSNGYLVQGWVAQEDKETGEIKINRNGGLSSLQIMSAGNSTYSPASTTQALYSGNIDDNDTNVTSDDGKTITLEFYDNKGYLYTGKFTLKDTGTDHLFSIQLTDIIDSDGNSIGAERMAGVKFGTTEPSEATVNPAYEVVVGATTSTVNLLAGATVYSGVPASGTLADLMTSSRSSYAGLLQKVYNISDKDVNDGTLGYSKTSPYTIDATSGTLTITYDQEVDGGSAKPNGYTYNTSNSMNYYVDKNGTGKAYLMPTNTSDSVSKLSTALKTTLKNVYRDQGATTTVTDADLTKYTNANYDYVFTSNGSGDDSFTIYAAPNIETTTTAKETSKSDLSKYYTDFTDLEATQAYADYDEEIFFTYSGLDKSKLTTDRQLTVYGSKLSDATTTEAVSAAQIGTITGIEKDVVLSYSSLDDTQKLQMAEALKAAGVISYADDAADDVKVAQMNNYMTDGGYTYFRINTLTGTDGIGFYKTMPEKVADTSNVLYTGQAFTRRLSANETAFPARAASELGAVYTNSEDYSAYVLKGTEKTVGDYNAQFLNDVYGLDASKFRANYQVSIASNGQISIYQTMEAQPQMDANYGTQQASDGSVTYVTKTDTVAWTDLPNSGNISDLLATAEGKYK